ncbi:uncharacterized protein [Atheta coriaria]|uniref:uncharacterized protein isoform X2 n=1 Tax=Dalotia coriaria TaxID=877792 RepID=UPI0031F40FA7
MSAQFIRIILMLIFAFACATGEKRTKTDIPCVSERECNMNHLRNSENDVSSACVDNYCEFIMKDSRINAPEMRVVTILDGRCYFNEECNIDGAVCEENLCTCANHTVSSYNKRKCLIEAKEIGDACVEDIQCNFPQTACRAGRCDCFAGFGIDLEQEDKTQCKELNGIGYVCQKDTDCEVEHTKCNTNKTCDCIDGYSAYQKECYEISVTYLSKCDSDIQCQHTLGPDAICINRTCHCQAKHIFSVLKNKCIAPLIPNGFNDGISTYNHGFYLFPWFSSLLMLQMFN